MTKPAPYCSTPVYVENFLERPNIRPFFAVSDETKLTVNISNTYSNLKEGKWQLAISSVGFRFKNEYFDRQLPIVIRSNIVRAEYSKIQIIICLEIFVFTTSISFTVYVRTYIARI